MARRTLGAASTRGRTITYRKILQPIQYVVSKRVKRRRFRLRYHRIKPCRRLWFRFRHDGDLVESATLHSAVLRAVATGDETVAADATDRLLDYLDAFARDTLTLN